MPKRGENIRKRKDGRWEGRYKNGIKPDGTVLYKSVYAKTYREVKEKLISAKNKKDLPVHQFSTEKIFSEILYLWEETNRVRIKKSTAQKYDYLIKTHIIPDLGGLKVSQITASAINLFLQKKLTDGRLDGKGKLSPSYVNSMTIIVKSAMEFAVSEQLCPPLKTTIHKPPVPKNEVRILSKEEQAAIEHYVNKTLTPTHVGILISLHTGLRIGEICALSWKDIDFCNRVIHVHHTVTRVKNDNANLSEKTQLILDLPKTKSSNRTVPISSALFSVISEFKKISV